VDAAVGAQAVICVVMPNAAGLGGDMLALVHQDGEVSAVNGTGASAGNQTLGAATGGSSVTVPGLVDGWLTMHRRWGRLPLGAVLEGAVQLARNGVPVDEHLATAVSNQRDRLDAGGAGSWSLLASQVGTRWRQPPLATLLEDVARRGADAFYAGAAADAMVAAVRRCGGSLSLEDLDSHETPCPSPVAVPWQGGVVHVQPPMSQGVLLAMALQEVGELAAAGVGIDDHVLVEVTEAAFAHRASCARGSELLAEKLTVDLHRAGGRGGPRAYLHTAGVAVADADGLVVSSLVSVFDDFGSGVFVPELGIVLNNRAAGFTDGANGPGPGKRPVHTLAPAIVTSGHEVLAIATPGADGQVQTLLQVLTATALQGRTLAEAVSFPGGAARTATFS
jgi:gamma-glutamyltranspeptidase/glutathione hydrolase